MDSIPQKPCPRCKETKPITEFAKCKGKRDGLQSNCDTCRHAHYREVFSDPVKAEQRRQNARDRYHNPKYRKAHNASQRKYEQRQYRDNPDFRHRKIVRSHRMRVKPRKDSYTRLEWEQLCARYNHRCLCCGEQKPLTADHVMPLSRGGSNTIDNLQPLCLLCNDRKHTKTIDYRP